jgi:UDP-N-acetylmuramoylalanine--D-glutamate ligase
MNIPSQAHAQAPQDERILVLGLGRSGRAAAELAHALGAEVVALDEGDSPALREYRDANAARFAVVPGWRDAALPAADRIVISPGLPTTSPLRRRAEAAGLPLVGELAFGAAACPWPMIAVTGTNGKTTTVELATHLLNGCGLRALAAGNIGHPLSQVALDRPELDLLVVEVSSFQLEHGAGFVPMAAALLNITSDHQDRHPDFADYAMTKLRLFAPIADPRQCLLRHDLPPWWQRAFPGRPPPATFASDTLAADWHLDGDRIVHRTPDGSQEPLCSLAETRLVGTHNAENLMAAAAIVHGATGLPLARLRGPAGEFRPGRHRLETVAEWRGIRFVNDSKATNPDAVVRALATVGGDRNVCLVAGGLDKDMDFRPVREAAKKIKCAFLVGLARNRLASCWNDVIHCTCCDSFEEAVLGATAQATPGDVVLLSPGCASMDMFRDYQERGERFSEIIQRRISP